MRRKTLRQARGGDGRASSTARKLRDDRPHHRAGHLGSDGRGIHQGSRLAAHPGGQPCSGPTLRDRHLPSRRAHRSNGFCPLQTLIGASFMHANAALSLTQNRQSPAEFMSSIAIKSATVPIAVEVARAISANPALTALFVVMTGMIGAAF